MSEKQKQQELTWEQIDYRLPKGVIDLEKWRANIVSSKAARSMSVSPETYLSVIDDALEKRSHSHA